MRVVVVGAGPAGAYAAAQLRRSSPHIAVDVLDRLPTPWGLLRAGVAPDHQEIKALGAVFDREVFEAGCHFLGGVQVGRDVSHSDLARRYNAVIYAVGAQSTRRLGIPGEDLLGSLAARDVVGWYNGHPDSATLQPQLGTERAVIIGNGNVAADVARILTRPVGALAETDVADHALAALARSQVKEVVVVGRRGPAQVAFTSAELHELGNLDGVELVVESSDLVLDPASARWLRDAAPFTSRRNMELLRCFAGRRKASSDSARRVVLRFLERPVAIHGRDRVEAVELERTTIEVGGDGALRARATRERRVISCGLVLSCLGYEAVPLPGVPFDEDAAVFPHDRGRVLEVPGGLPIRGTYVVGWAKRGPTGILGTNKRDAEETVASLLEDEAAGRLLTPVAGDRSTLEALLRARGVEPIDYNGWRRIDEHELQVGRAKGRPRVKLATHADLHAKARS